MEYQRWIRGRQVERARQMLENLDPETYKKGPNDVTRFIKRQAKTKDTKSMYILDEEKIAEEEKYDGFYAIATNLDCSNTDDVREILRVSAGRSRIEDCFRIMKTNFDSRPVYHRLPERIKAHFMICYTALLVYRLLEVQIERSRFHLSVNNVIETLPPTGHIAADDWTVTLDPTCTEPGLQVKYCKYGCLEEGEPVIVESEPIDPLGHALVIDHVVDPTATEQGYTVYKCTRCDYTENGNYVDPLARYTVTFIVGDESEAIERALGETITSSMLTISTDKASDDEYKYTFDCWKKAEKNADDEWVATDTTVKMPITVSEDMAVIATYKSSLINYRIDFLYDDGESYKIKGYEHWNNVVTVEDPTKDPSETETFTFAGWKKAEKNSDDVWVATGDFVEEIVCKGDATYIAVFTATPITYTVIWADRSEGSYTALKTLTVAGGTDVTGENPALTGITLKTPNQNGHWVATGWDNQEDAANVTKDLVIRPVQTQQAHSYTTTSAAVSCTSPAKTIYTCACGYSYETTTGRPLGHDYSIEVSRVNPTADADGYKIMKCSRCSDQTNVPLPRIFLKITVQDQNHNKVSGVTVKVYDGDTFINSGVSDSNGVATILVPEAKTYRIVIEGREGTVTVNENGKVTNSNIPTVERSGGGSSGGNSGCDCTCHKSGFWPMIFRFFHKLIKMMTGEFRCCPDANY